MSDILRLLIPIPGINELLERGLKQYIIKRWISYKFNNPGLEEERKL